MDVPPTLQMKKPGSDTEAFAQGPRASEKDRNSGHLAPPTPFLYHGAASQDNLMAVERKGLQGLSSRSLSAFTAHPHATPPGRHILESFLELHFLPLSLAEI